MIVNFPDEVRHIIDTLEKSGHEAYAAGGCIRDSLLGNIPQDWDICTSALPEQTKQVFLGGHIIETGLKHGTVTLMLNCKPYEITTYRVDGKYKDNRRPETVRFVSVLKRDLARRDFTINAMAYNPKTGLVDYYGGRRDLAEKKIKCVGNAGKRFCEDALRIMRALRFASVFGFSIEPDTAAAMHKNKKLLHNISPERISAEFDKLILGGGVKRILSDHAGIIGEIIPEIRDLPDYVLSGVKNAPKDPAIRLAALLRVNPDTAENILSGLKYDRDTIKKVSQLILYRNFEITSRPDIKRLLGKIGGERFRELIELKKAESLALGDEITGLDEIQKTADEIIGQKQCFSLRDLALKGEDLILAGMPKGPKIGAALNLLLDMVIDETAENDKKVLLDKIFVDK